MIIYFLFLVLNSHIMNKSVGEKLKVLRKSRGLSLEDILQKLQISESTYLRMEKGETATWTSKIDKICEIYQIEPEELLLSKEKYVFITNNQQNGTITGNVVNNLSEKVIELYERMLSEKNVKILELESKLKI